MRDDFDPQIAERFAVLVDVAVPDTWSLVQSKCLSPASASFVEEESAVIDLVAERHERLERHRRRSLISAAALVGAASVIAVMVLVPLGGDTLVPADESVAVSEPSVSIPSPTTSPANTTIEQYERVVTQHSAEIGVWIDIHESSDHVEDSFPQYVRERYLELRPLLARFQVSLAELPSPPAEIATLVAETKQQVGGALDSVDLLLSCGAASIYTPCADERSEAEAAYKALPALFAKWRPSPASTPIAPGEEISVSADLVEFGDGLVGLIDNMDRAEGRTYVIAGHYETETDLFFPPEESVLAAFDDVGRELWRTELDGTPTKVAAVAGDVWVWHESGALSRIDASDGRFIDRVTVGNAWEVFAAFGSVWVYALDLAGGPGQLIRVRQDMSTTSIELPASIIASLDDVPPLDPAVGAGEIWVPLGGGGVAVVDVETGRVMVISVDDIGHEVGQVAVHDDVAYVASGNEVTSMVDGQVGATVALRGIMYLGPVDGVFGAWTTSQGFVVLRADDPMKAEVRQVTLLPAREIDGEAWREEGRNYNLRRVELGPISAEDG